MKRSRLPMTSGILALTLMCSITAEAKRASLFDMLFGSNEEQSQPQKKKKKQQPQFIEEETVPSQPINQPWEGETVTTAPVINTEGLTEKEKVEAIINEFRGQPLSGQIYRVVKTEWSEEDENLYGQFIQKIGRAVRDGVCYSVKGCMRNPKVNMFANRDNPGLVLYSDCADFPYLTRAYFAYHMGLPFSYASEVALLQTPVASLANRQDDLAQSLVDGRLDNSPYGNIVTARSGNNIPQQPGGGKNLEIYLEYMFDMVSTRTFRAGPMNPSLVPLDTYPVRVNKEGIRPGTILVSTGHVGSIFEVDAEGSAYFVDAHPDGSLSFKMVKPSTLDRSRPEHGLGFFRFRNVRVSGGAYDRATGEVYGGRAIPVGNEELIASGKYSWSNSGANTNVRPDQAVSPTAWSSSFSSPNFFDYLAMSLRGQGVWTEADQSVVKLMDSLCAEMKQRVADVDLSLGTGLQNTTHPESIPANIFNAEEPWESMSSPGRDGRMRASVSDIVKAAVSQWQLYKAPGTGVRFQNGKTASDFRNVLRNELAKMDNKCQIAYTKSDGSSKTLVFSDVLSRLNKMSFDPYHCAEKRWGASGSELSSCRDGDQGNTWYNAQAYMRNYKGKVNSAEKTVIRSTQPITLDLLSMGYIDQPDSSLINLGFSAAPLMNLDAVLASDRFMKALDSGSY